MTRMQPESRTQRQFNDDSNHGSVDTDQVTQMDPTMRAKFEEVMGEMSVLKSAMASDRLRLMKIEESHMKLREFDAKLWESNAKLEESNAKLGESNAKLEESGAKLEESNAKLEESNAKLGESSAKLEKANAKLEEANMKLQSSNADLEEANARLELSNAKLEEALPIQAASRVLVLAEELKKDHLTLKESVSQLQNHVASLETEFSTRRREFNHTIDFLFRLQADVIPTPICLYPLLDLTRMKIVELLDVASWEELQESRSIHQFAYYIKDELTRRKIRHTLPTDTLLYLCSHQNSTRREGDSAAYSAGRAETREAIMSSQMENHLRRLLEEMYAFRFELSVHNDDGEDQLTI